MAVALCTRRRRRLGSGSEVDVRRRKCLLYLDCMEKGAISYILGGDVDTCLPIVRLLGEFRRRFDNESYDESAYLRDPELYILATVRGYRARVQSSDAFVMAFRPFMKEVIGSDSSLMPSLMKVGPRGCRLLGLNMSQILS